MPRPLTEPLCKVTLNLFLADRIALKRRYGQGWTEQVRLIVHDNVRAHSQAKRVIDLISEDMVDGED